jgi:hypothetical protein
MPISYKIKRVKHLVSQANIAFLAGAFFRSYEDGKFVEVGVDGL